jgi:hypothetical protein
LKGISALPTVQVKKELGRVKMIGFLMLMTKLSEVPLDLWEDEMKTL